MGPGRRWGSQDLWDPAREAGGRGALKGVKGGEWAQLVSGRIGRKCPRPAWSSMLTVPELTLLLGPQLLPADLPAENSVDQSLAMGMRRRSSSGEAQEEQTGGHVPAYLQGGS